ncbi:hypothetical protein B7P43_G13810 [Cryptotermes secundus]|uniref:Helicase C-terminal domain-containing protein n=5 Tax=Cryptotermes secundus TaxID=105785 RepID=A0A2J7R9N5_9NEOP|nr:hypothetical protein B7P43_G13810 [Cryptotermes secundus]
MNNMQNATGNQNPMANQTTMGNAQGAMNSMQTSMEGNIVNKNQNPVGTPQSPIGNQQNTAGQQHSAVGNQSPMGTQNSVGTPQTIIGNQQNTMGTAQNSMVNPHNPMAMQQNPMGSTHNSMGASQNSVGTPQPLTGTQQNPVGTPQNVMINSQNPMGNGQNMMGTPNALGAPQNSMGMSQNLMGPTQNMMGPPQSSMGTPQSALGTVPNLMAAPQNSMGNPQNPIGSSQSAVGTSQSTMGNPQNPMTTHQNPVTSPQNVMAVSQNPMGPPQSSIGTPHSPVGSQQNMLGTLKNPMAAPNAMGVPQNQIGTSQDSAGNAQNLMGNPQNPLNSFQGSVGNNSQNLNIMQNTHNHMHGHPEIGGNSGNSMQDTYGRMSGMDPNNSSQNTAYDAGNNMSSYRHQQIFQNSNNRPCLQQGNSSCGSSADSLYGSMPENVQYLGENMGSMPICKTEPGSQNTLSNMMTGEGSSSGTSGSHGNSELSLYGPPSGGIPYSNRWEDNSGSGRFLSTSQQSEENKGKCEDNIKEESQNMSTDGSTLIANKDKLKLGEEEKGQEQKNSCNPQLKSVDSSDQRISCEKQPLSREGYSSNGDPAKCLTEMKPVDSGTNTEQDGKSSTVTSCNMQQSGNIPPSSLKTEDKISLNCSNETQTDIPLILTNNYGNLNVKSDMSTQHNAFKMESGVFKSDGQAFERNSSPHLRDVKEYELGNDSKDRKANDSADGRRCESMVESKDASCGTQNFDCPKDLNLNEGKQVVELGAGAARNMGGREDPGIPYDWATELLKNYIPGSIENSAKMEVLFCILEESMALGDRMLVFSQSLFTLNLIEDFLQRNNLPGRQEKWARNCNYYRLDGSTSALEREKLINEYNSNPNIHLFLVSTRAGSLGINLVGANRVIVFDASWNPCHDTQAVCRVYRYGQKKPCFVYRLVMDNCLEKKIYDRQINKQGMADRVVDECNPDAHLSIKEVTNLCWDNEQDTEPRDFSAEKDKYIDVVLQKVLDKFSSRLSKEPFQHESLLVDRKEKKLSQAEKRLAKRSYELEKQANINYSHRPQYSYYPGGTSAVGNAGIQGTGLQIRAIRTDGSGGVMPKPVASVRPMQAELSQQLERGQANRSTVTTLNTSGRSRWIPAEVWQRQGMSAQEMTLPLDVVIPTNSPDRASIVLKAGQRVMVLKSPKGIYMQLENGKIIAIRTAFKVGGAGKGSAAQQQECKPPLEKAEMNTPEYKKESNAPTINRTVNMAKVSNVLPFKNNSAITIIPKNTAPQQRGAGKPMSRVGGNSSGGGILKQDVTVKPWGPRIGTSVDVAPVTMGGNKNISSQQPMVQARPYFHRTSANNSTDMGSAKPYFHHDTSSDHLGMMGHQTSDEGSSGAENMSSTPCAEDKDGVDGGVLKSPSSDDFNQDNSMSSHAFRSIQESNISNKSSYDSHMGDDMLHDSGAGMGMAYGNHADQGIQEPNINSSYGRQMGQDTRDPPVTANRSFRRQMDQGLQGAGNVGHPFARQPDQRVQETSANLSRGYGRQVDQGVHDASTMSHRYGRHMEQGYHDASAGANHGFGRQLDQGIQETGGINRSFGRQNLEGITYNQQSQARSYDEHKDANFNRSDSSSGGRYGQTDTESGSNRNFHGTYEDSWQQGQVFRGMSRVSDGTHGHGGGMADSRSYHQPFKSSSHGVEKHSLPDNSTREQQRNNFPDYSQRQQLQEPESPTFQTEVTDSATGGNDSGVEILPLPTSTFTPVSKEPLPQQSTNRSAPQGKTTSLKNYRHNSFSAQLHSREVESSTSSDNTTAPITRTLQEKPLSGDHYMKSSQQTSYPTDIKSPSGFQQSNEDLKVSNQNLTVSGYPQGGNVGSVFLGTGNPSVGQHTLPSSKTHQKNAPNIGRFNSEVSSGGNFSAGGMPSAVSIKSKRGNSRSEQQHYEFESSDTTSDAGRINAQQQPHGKRAGRNQMYPLQPQAYHAHTSPQQAQSQTPPASNPASIATTSVSKKGRGNKNTSSDRSPSYSAAASNTESDLHRNADGSSSKNQPQQPSPQNVPVQMQQSAPVFPPNPQYPASDGSSSSPVYGHQQYYPTPGYYGGFGGPQQPPVAFGGNPYYSGESQYGAGRGAHLDQSVPPVNKDIHKGNQSQAGTSPTQPQQQSVQPLPQSTTPAKTQQTPSGIGSQKKEQSSQLGNSTAASDSPTKVGATATNPSTPTTTRDMTSPSSASGGSRSGNNSARSTPATVANTNISQEPNSPQLHFNTPTTSASSTSLENRSPVQYNSSMTTNPAPLDPKSPLQYNSSVTSGNSSSSAAPSHQYNSSATGVNSSASTASSLDYNSSATSSNFTAGTGSTPQGGIIPPPPHQSPYEPMMLGGYPAGAPGTGYAAPPPPPGMGYGSYSNPANQYEADYARASMYSAFHRPDPHPHPFAPGHPPGFLPSPQSTNYYPQNMYAPTPYGTPDPAYYSNPFLNAMHQHPYPTLPGAAQNPGSHPQ